MSGFLTPFRAFCLGVVILLGVQLGAAGLYFLGVGSWFGREALTVHAGFDQIRGIEPKTRVRIQGIDAGEVTEILPPDKPGAKVVLRLLVKAKYRDLVRADSRVQIVGEGLLGAKVLEILPPKADNSPPAADHAFLQEEPSHDLADVLNEVNTTLASLKNKDGTLGKLVHDPQAYNALVTLFQQSTDTMSAFQQDAEAIKRLPLVGGYVEDPVALLVRPHCERNAQVFAAEELFEPGRAVLTAHGQRRLDELAPWLAGMKHKGSEVVVVAYADPKTAQPAPARVLTREQAKAVCDYLRKQHAIQKMGWFSSRPVTPLGMGTASPPAADRDPPPPDRVEVLVFVPQSS